MLSLALCSGPAGGNCGALGLKRHSPGKRTGRNHASARDVWVGSRAPFCAPARYFRFTPISRRFQNDAGFRIGAI